MIAGWHELLHQVGWSWTIAKYQGCGCQEIFLEKYCHPVWDSSYPHLEQWPSIWQQSFQEVLLWPGHNKKIFHPGISIGNGQTEAVNKVIVSGLKKRLDDVKGKWVEELSHVLWTYQTTPCGSTRETPFSMTYRAEAIIPLEIGFPTLRTSSFTPSNNNGLLGKSLDLIEERRENAMVQLAYYQHKLKQGYDANIKLRPLAPGDLVLKKILGTTKNPT